MILEKMLELLLLEQYENNMVSFNEKRIDWYKYYKRLDELREEFLSPYVIDSTSKED